MDKIIKLLVTSVLLIASGNATASIIDMGDYQYDDVSKLEWLDLTFTIGISRSQALAAFSKDGWGIANELQFHEMYGQYDGTSADGSVYGHSEGHRDYTDSGFELSTTTRHNTIADWGYLSFVEDFGLTQDISVNLNSSGAIDEFVQRSLGLYDTVDSATMRLGGLIVTVHTGEYRPTSDELINLYDYDTIYTRSTALSVSGFFMIRAIQVPEPPIILLMGIGLVGLGFTRRNAMKF